MTLARRLAGLWENDLVPWLAARERKPLGRQAAEILRLRRLHGALPAQYLFNRLYLRDAPENLGDFLPRAMVFRVLDALNAPQAYAQLDDKRLFRVILERHGLPGIRELVRIDRAGAIRDADDRLLSRAAAEALLRAHGGRLFVKRTGGTRGAGAMALAPGDDLAPVFAPGPDRLVQPFLDQHPALVTLAPRTLNTIRIDTFRHGGATVSNAAFLRMGVGAAVADNWAAGGIAVGIDLGTGRLRAWGRRKSALRDDRRHDRHPDTGTIFEGFEIPMWAEIRDLVVRAAPAFPDLPCIGWDVAVTPEGPVLVEGNRRWDPDAFQNGGAGLAPTPIGQAALGLHRTGRI